MQNIGRTLPFNSRITSTIIFTATTNTAVVVEFVQFATLTETSPRQTQPIPPGIMKVKIYKDCFRLAHIKNYWQTPKTES